MEKYELNKFIDEYSKKINDLKVALKVDTNKDEIKRLEEISSSQDFWLDSSNAQKIMANLNDLKAKNSEYKEVENKFNDIKDVVELNDEEMLLLIDDEVKAFLSIYNKLEIKALLNQKYDNSNCILELHPGAGGTESMDWAQMLFRMYQRYAQKKGFKFEVLDYQAGDEAGIKSVQVLISGPYAYGLLKGERGVHRLIRISPFDSNKRRHTSFCSCDIAPDVNDDADIEIKDEDIRIDVYHSSGAGGQSVNTTDSAVRITHYPTGIVVTCQNERSQLQNKEMCFKILKSKLLDLEIRKKEEELRKLKGETLNIDFGSQIRTYVFTPYKMVKDHRSLCEVSNVDEVMDGEITPFIDSYLKYLSGE